MVATVNAGARLDRLPISSFHYRIFWLIGAGMFFDGYDLYVGTTVLGRYIAEQILDPRSERAIHFAYLPWHDHRRLPSPVFWATVTDGASPTNSI